MLKKLLNMNIAAKMICLLVLVILLFLGVVLLYFIPTVERELLIDRKAGLKSIVEVSYSLLEEYEQRAKDGEFSRQEAQERAMTRIRQMRYGNNDYLWINDDTLPYPRMIMHPTVPALDGKILDEQRFACATRLEFGVGGRVQTIPGRDKNLFQAFVEVIKQSGEGFVTYDWPRPTRDGASTELFSKESYVALYQPWGWVIGTGVYIDDIQAQVARLRWAMLAVTGGIMAVVMVLAVFIVSSITRPVNALVRYAEAVSQGDLGADLQGRFAAETGRLKTAITKMVHELKEVIGQAEAKTREAEQKAHEANLATEEANQAKLRAETAKRDGMLQAATNIEAVVERMTSASEELSAQVEEASRGAEEQKNRTAETATAMEEMNATVLEVARNASQAAEASDQARTKAKDGAKVVSASVEAINTVQAKAQEMKGNLDQLGRQAEQIGRIMTVIEDIADQTNLLALNAAIEAARAGDAGRGFAVVADEVRKLAEKTMNATKEVGEAISAIQQGTQANIRGMDQSVSAIEDATRLANQSGDALREILSLAEQAADQVRSIATAAEQQSATSEEINRGVEDISRISSETSVVMDQSAQAVSELSRQAVELQEVVQRMKQG
ncbi:methyl-accepting chemotaxis protein [Desulfonatronum sp. SC1]|uniref:methyl-accepting chemotaxis protein n=1 Tax=Desulfonatronum sp. SC1 TaxID=2109626 RepID=UPI000D31E516|nr:methyl-accepting chemotaxis protein [Desulfonatronum sp. SC1]PTN37322.1 hypothetical protein C6366_06675 [Desulfonatronum sp. SC1]